MPEKEKAQPKENQDQLHPRTVCGREMTADIAWYPHAEYQGRTIHFCTEFCLEAFEADPERFYIAHSRKKDHHIED
jgi:YHS domain-containing protein